MYRVSVLFGFSHDGVILLYYIAAKTYKKFKDGNVNMKQITTAKKLEMLEVIS